MVRGEPEVPKVKVRVVECRDGLARITLEELAITHFVKRWHPPECLYYKTKSGCRFGEKCSCEHRQVDAQPSKWSKSNTDKSAVAILKKGNWRGRENLSQMLVTIERGNLCEEVIRNWDKIHPDVSFLMHDNWVAYFRT